MSITTSTHTTRTADDDIAVVRRFVDEILNEGRFDALTDIVHPDYRYEGPDGTTLDGPDALAALIGGYRAAFSDFHVEITSEVADRGIVAVSMTMTGTHDGEFDGIPATGERIGLPVAVFSTVSGGRIVDEREFFDTGTLLSQLGLGAPGSDESGPAS